jgi:hypothetical protein
MNFEKNQNLMPICTNLTKFKCIKRSIFEKKSLDFLEFTAVLFTYFLVFCIFENFKF